MKVFVDEGGFMPLKAHEADAGFDLFAPDDFVVSTEAPAIIDTKVHIQIPKGYVGMIMPKSGLNIKENILSFGVVDAEFENTIVVKLYKLGGDNYRIKKGDKISQIIFLPISEVNKLTEVKADEFYQNTERGNGRMGSTGR